MLQIRHGIGIAMIFALSVTLCLHYEVSIVVAILVVLSTAALILKLKGGQLTEVFLNAFKDIKEAKHVYLLVLMIGMNVSMWIASGTLSSIIYYGFSIVDKIPLLPFAFVLSGILAFFLGTGLGTVSTIGIAFFALGKSAGLPEGILLGAIVSGAYIADRLSPLSALVNFALETAEVRFKEAFTATIKPIVPAAVVTGFAYWAIGSLYPLHVETDHYKALISSHFQVSPLVLVLPLLVLILSFLNKGTVTVLLSGIATGFALTIGLQQDTALNGLKYLLLGYTRQMNDPWLSTLNIGGVFSMVEVVIVIAGGIALLSLLESGGFIEKLKNRWFSPRDTAFKLFAKAGLLSTTLDALTCDQTVGILLPSKHLKTSFESRGMKRENLYACIASSGTSLAPLMPWNVNAVIIFAITGVSATQFAPFAFLNWLHFPIALILMAIIKK